MKELTKEQQELLLRSMRPWLEATEEERNAMIRRNADILNNGGSAGVFDPLPGDWSPRPLPKLD